MKVLDGTPLTTHFDLEGVLGLGDEPLTGDGVTAAAPWQVSELMELTNKSEEEVLTMIKERAEEDGITEFDAAEVLLAENGYNGGMTV